MSCVVIISPAFLQLYLVETKSPQSSSSSVVTSAGNPSVPPLSDVSRDNFCSCAWVCTKTVAPGWGGGFRNDIPPPLVVLLLLLVLPLVVSACRFAILILIFSPSFKGVMCWSSCKRLYYRQKQDIISNSQVTLCCIRTADCFER